MTILKALSVHHAEMLYCTLQTDTENIKERPQGKNEELVRSDSNNVYLLKCNYFYFSVT